MNKEQIEQAAKQSIHECYNCNGVFPCIHKDECKYNNGHNTSYDCAECGADDFNKGFIKGADWRINSVWHKPCDIAEPGKDCLVEHMDGDGNVCIRIDWRSEYEWVQACHYDKVLRWAYVEDLLPTKT